MVNVFKSRVPRLLQPQLILSMLTLGAFVLIVYFFRGNEKKEIWEVRKEQLLKYDMPEISIDFIRKFGHVDHKIEALTDEVIATMNETELMVTVHSFLDNADILCRRKIRMGNMGDGGWELCDDQGLRPRRPPCLVYSFGVVADYAFEDDVSRIYKCEVHSFNPNLPGTDFNRSRLVFVHPYGAGRNTEITPNGKELYTMEDIRTILGHVDMGIDIIKIDTESSEWSALTHMTSNGQLDDVRQLLVEFHIGFPPNLYKLSRAVKILRGLSRLGFRKFYVHKNPKGSFHHPGFPVVRAKNYEVHYINANFLPPSN